jgi:hypothetical protein
LPEFILPLITNVFSQQLVSLRFVPYTFTVVANSKSGNSAPSAPSNAISWTSAPGYPAPVLTRAVSDTQIDVEWVPSTSTGGLSNYGYNVIRWEVTLNAYGRSQ